MLLNWRKEFAFGKITNQKKFENFSNSFCDFNDQPGLKMAIPVTDLNETNLGSLDSVKLKRGLNTKMLFL